MRTSFPAVVLVCLGLVGCPRTTEAPEPLFTADNAWPGDVPARALQLDAGALRARLDAGTLVLVTPAAQAAARAARQAQYQADLGTLRGLSQPSPAVQALLAEAAAQSVFEGDRPVSWEDGGGVMLLGIGARVRNAVLAQARGESATNALGDYSLGLALAPPALRAQLPAPAALSGKQVGEVRQALRQLEALLGSDGGAVVSALVDQSSSPPQANGSAPDAGSSWSGIDPGNGSNADGACSPTNYAARAYFPLKYFITPVKNQAMRGTCWAFTALGALESRELVEADRRTSLSVQFLVNKVKQDWDSSDDVDAYDAQEALHTAANLNQPLMTEDLWTYNRASLRPRVKDGDSSSYAHACDGYTGSCSESAHESPQYCATELGFHVCSYGRVDFTGPGVISNDAVQVWQNGDPFDLHRLQQYLAQGYPLMATFPVFRGFDEAPKTGPNAGVVSDYSQTHYDSVYKKYVDGPRGGHEVLIVGFLPNQVFSTSAGGGGYFIVKNSWGCGVGDQGFYYVPADYVAEYFETLSVVTFGSTRGLAWKAEQALPGSTVAPTVQTMGTPVTTTLEAPADLAPHFTISHPLATQVALEVSSSAEGTLFSGPWTIGSGGLQPSLVHRFTKPGLHTITVTARFGVSQAQATFSVVVLLNDVHATLKTPANVYQGLPALMGVAIDDQNVTDPTTLCATTLWAVDPPDTLTGSPGCQALVTFGATGERQVRVLTQDGFGQLGSAQSTLTVQAPPTNPYPLVTASGVYAHQLVSGPIGSHCGAAQVPSASTLDLKQDGCSGTGIPPFPPLYFGAVTVENPTAEALTYSWTLFFTDATNGEQPLLTAPGSASPSFPLSSTGEVGITGPCRLVVTVNAPEVARSKQLEVWSGTCTRYAPLP